MKNLLCMKTFATFALLNVLFLAMPTGTVSAETSFYLRNLTGTIKDANGIPVANAAVFVKQSTLATVTNLKVILS
jgi:hypothetical protein